MEFSVCGRLLATAGQDSVVVSNHLNKTTQGEKTVSPSNMLKLFPRNSLWYVCVCEVHSIILQRVWVLRTAYLFFHELQAQYQRLGVHSSVDSLSEKASVASSSSKSSEVSLEHLSPTHVHCSVSPYPWY